MRLVLLILVIARICWGLMKNNSLSVDRVCHVITAKGKRMDAAIAVELYTAQCMSIISTERSVSKCFDTKQLQVTCPVVHPNYVKIYL